MGLFFLHPIWRGNEDFMRHFFPNCGNPARLRSRINPAVCHLYRFWTSYHKVMGSIPVGRTRFFFFLFSLIIDVYLRRCEAHFILFTHKLIAFSSLSWLTHKTFKVQLRNCRMNSLNVDMLCSDDTWLWQRQLIKRICLHFSEACVDSSAIVYIEKNKSVNI